MQKGIFKGVVLFVLAVSLPCFANAELLIIEIMYDASGTDTGREWVEIYNSGPNSITVITGSTNSGWRLYDGSQHTLTLVDGSNVLGALEYAIIVDNPTAFLADYPSYSGNLFDSSFSLNNSSETVSIFSSKDGDTLDSVSYTSSQGASGDGSSLQRQSDGSWIGATPTPGALNSTVATTSGVENSAQSSSTTNSQNLTSYYNSTPLIINTSKAKVFLSIGQDRLGTVGAPLEFPALSLYS